MKMNIFLVTFIAVCLSIQSGCGSGPVVREEEPDISLAVQTDDIETVRRILDSGFNLNSRDSEGRSLLHSVMRWDEERVKRRCFNLSAGKQTGIVSGMQKPELPRKKAVDMASLIIEKGADVNAKTNDGQTPLEIALSVLKPDSPDIPSVPPVAGGITSRFGWRGSPFDNTSDYHRGLDICARNGTPVYASADGVVTGTGVSEMLGNNITIRHRNGYRTIYGHCHLFAIRKGAYVRRGAKIGYVGRTGAASGDHCHYEVHINGAPVDPVEFLNKKSFHDMQHAIVRGLVELLLSKKADVDVRDKDGRTPLVVAASKSGALSMLLVGHGAGINLCDQNGITPLHAAAGAGDPELVRFLLDRGASVNARINAQYCAISGVLFGTGATPLNVALKSGNGTIADMLRRRGAVE